jgi:hypothetical protein
MGQALNSIKRHGAFNTTVQHALLKAQILAQQDQVIGHKICSLIYFLKQDYHLAQKHALKVPKGDSLKKLIGTTDISFSGLKKLLKELTSSHSIPRKNLEEQKLKILKSLLAPEQVVLARLWVFSDWHLNSKRSFYEKHLNLLQAVFSEAFQIESYNAATDHLILKNDSDVSKNLQRFCARSLPCRSLSIKTDFPFPSSELYTKDLEHLRVIGAELIQPQQMKRFKKLKTLELDRRFAPSQDWSHSSAILTLISVKDKEA